MTRQTGIDFIHDAGATGKYLVPEQMGSGGAFLDFDNDGRLDIYLIQNAGPNSTSRNRLFHQEAGGRFTDVSAGSGLDVAGAGMGAAAGDMNNDGWIDLLLTEYGGARLFLNQRDGSFREMTSMAGVDNPHWGMSAAFFDYDRDGWLDIVIANYLDYDPTQKCFDARGAAEFCGPHGFPGTVTKLFRNLGARSGAPANPPEGAAVPPGIPLPRFEDVTVPSGLARFPGPALGVLCADFNGDRWPDVFLSDDGQPNRLFINQRDGTFTEEAAVRGLAYTSMGQTAGDMGVAVGDVDRDGMFDLFVTHLAEENHSLWIQGPRGLFQDRTAAVGLNYQAWRGTGFGAAFADFDGDGDLDLAFVNGRVKRDPALPENIAKEVRAFWAPYAQRNQLFAADGRGRFRDISLQQPAFCAEAMVGRGLACGDFNNDGAIDLLVTSTGGPAKLFRNIARNRGHWLSVRALDPSAGGRDAYGAEIVIEAGQERWWGLAQPGYSYLCSSDPRVHFGLGEIARMDRIRIVWPDGKEEEFPGTDADRFVILKKGEGKPATANR